MSFSVLVEVAAGADGWPRWFPYADPNMELELDRLVYVLAQDERQALHQAVLRSQKFARDYGLRSRGRPRPYHPQNNDGQSAWLVRLRGKFKDLWNFIGVGGGTAHFVEYLTPESKKLFMSQFGTKLPR